MQPVHCSLDGENSFGTDKQIKVIRRVIPHESEQNQLGGGGGEAYLSACVCGEGQSGLMSYFFTLSYSQLSCIRVCVSFVCASVQTHEVLLQCFSLVFL